MHHLSVYLRARDAGPQANNSTLRQHLLNHTNEQNSHDDAASSDESCAPKKKIMIRIKSSSTDSINDDDDGSAVVPEDDPLLCIQNHRWLSPSRPIAKALIYLLYATDLAVGTYLVTSAFLQKQISDDYGYLMSRLTSGLLLSGGSLAGICLHTPAKTLICGGNASTNKSLMIFNTSFAFIAVGIYYMVSTDLICSMVYPTQYFPHQPFLIGIIIQSLPAWTIAASFAIVNENFQ